MTNRECEHCKGPLAASARSHARYCGTSCRVMASRARKRKPAEVAAPLSLPRALTRSPRWIRHNAAKVPLTVAGGLATSTNPATWSPFADACASTAGTGLGVVLTGDGTVCVDIDHCITDGALSDDAETFLAGLPPTYIELSPSGTGLHVWGTGLVLSSRKFRRTPMQGEVIGSRKYVTVTGTRFRNAPLSLANIAAQAGALIF